MATLRILGTDTRLELTPRPDGSLGVDLDKVKRFADDSPRMAGEIVGQTPGGQQAATVPTPRTYAQARPADLLAEPNAAEMAVNFTVAMAGWVKAGLPVVDEATYAARSAACEPCEYWDGGARLGLGKCKAPGCGCTKFKRWLATERCKHPQGSRWPVL